MKFFNYKSFFAIFTIALFLSAVSCMGQGDKSKRASPPAKATANVGDAQVTIDYSQPSVKGREIFGGLVPYNKVWRTGANEPTTFEVSKDVLVEGKPLPAGKYAMFTIPGEKEWTIIFSKNAKAGANAYKQEEDALRVKVKPTATPENTELFTFHVQESGEVSMVWADTQVVFQVEEK